MLEMKEKCENCGAALPMDSDKAVICSYECTFCEDCAGLNSNKGTKCDIEIRVARTFAGGASAVYEPVGSTPSPLIRFPAG